MSISVPSLFFSSSFWTVDSANEDKQISITILSLFVLIFALLWFRRSKIRPPPLPPGPRGLPLVGYLPFLSGNLHRDFADLAQIHGPVFKLRLGAKLCVVLTSPVVINEALRSQDTLFATRDPTACALLATYGGADIVFAQDGGDWKKLRKIFARKMLSKSSLDGSYSVRRREVRKAIEGVFESAGRPIDVGEVGFFATLKSMMAMILGRRMGEEGGDLEGELRGKVGELMVLLGTPNLSDLFPALGGFDLQGIGRKTKRVMRVIDGILDFTIEEQRNGVKNGGGFLQRLLELEDSEDSSESITTSQLKALLMDIVIGGTDTTTTMIEWVMAELMQHRDIMKKVIEELTEVVGSKQMVEEFHLSKLCFLTAVIKETFRVHPPLPLLVPRTRAETGTLGGYSIPKGSTIYFNIWAIQRDPKVWDNPLKFMPERFLNEPEKYDFTGNSIEFCPFGSGKRACAGIPLAERMLIFVLASLLHAFQWELPKDSSSVVDLEEKFGIVAKKLKPLVAVPVPRLSNLELFRS